MNAQQLKKAMTKTFALLAFVCLLGFTANAQRIAYVDVASILGSVNDYTAAQQTLDKQAAKWRQDIAQEYDQIKGLYNKYQAEQVLLSEDARQQREEEIMDREKRVRDMQKAKFGPEGELFQRRQELVQPIQDRVYSVIEDYANEKGYDFIFDKAGSTGMIFSNERYDKTEDIIDRLK